MIDKRLRRAAEEAEGIESYDYIVINDDLEVCTKELHSIIFAAHNAVDRNEGFIEKYATGTECSGERRKIMLHPSYADLIKVVNSGVEEGEDPVVSSRYSIVMATSKRARQIIAGDEVLVDGRGKKPLSVAVEELNQGKIQILTDESAEETEEISEEISEEETVAEVSDTESPEAEEAVEE